jgi:hypothetical protein
MIDQHPENITRGQRARAALLAYHNEITLNPADDIDFHQTLTDLLTDLHHFADTESLPFYERYARSDDCYKEELADPTL